MIGKVNFPRRARRPILRSVPPRLPRFLFGLCVPCFSVPSAAALGMQEAEVGQNPPHNRPLLCVELFPYHMCIWTL